MRAVERPTSTLTGGVGRIALNLDSGPLVGSLTGGWRRRRWVVFDHGPKAHLFAKVLRATGPIAACGKTGGTVLSWPQVRERDVCARCWATKKEAPQAEA